MVLSNDMKKAIAFGLIIGAILSVCNMCFAAELEEISYTGVIEKCINSNGVLVGNNNYDTYYFEISPGYTYYVSTESMPSGIFFGNDIVLGSEVTATTNISANTTISFSYSDYQYLYVFNLNNIGAGGPRVTISREATPGLSSFVDNISYSLSYVNLNSIVASVVPILAIGVLIGLGFYLLKRVINKMKRAKGGV